MWLYVAGPQADYGSPSNEHNQRTLVAATAANGGTTHTPSLHHLSLVGERLRWPNTSLSIGIAAHDIPSNYPSSPSKTVTAGVHKVPTVAARRI